MIELKFPVRLCFQHIVITTLCIFAFLTMPISSLYASDHKNSKEQKPNWSMEINNEPEVCEGFLDYLNRKPVFYYATGLQPDPEFAGFSLPVLTPVKKEDFIHIPVALHQKWLVSLKEFGRKPFPNEPKSAQEHVEQFFANEARLYTADLDINNDSKPERVLVRVENKFYTSIDTVSYMYHVLKEDNTLNIQFKGNVSGMPFFIDKTFYVVKVTDIYADVHKPSIPYKQTSGVSIGLRLCSYRPTQ